MKPSVLESSLLFWSPDYPFWDGMAWIESPETCLILTASRGSALFHTSYSARRDLADLVERPVIAGPGGQCPARIHAQC